MAVLLRAGGPDPIRKGQRRHWNQANVVIALNVDAPDQQEQIAQEGNAAQKRAVTDQGIALDEYNSIVQTAQSDPALRERLVQRLGGTAK